MGLIDFVSESCGFCFVLQNDNLTCLLLINSRWQPEQPSDGNPDGLKGIYRVDVDTPADDWSNIADFYDVLVFNTGHW